MKQILFSLLLAVMFIGCSNNTYQVGNPKEQATVKVFLKQNNLDFTDYYVNDDEQTGYHQGLVHGNDKYIDFNSVVYKYGDKDKQINNVVYLIDKNECMFVLDYLNYINIYGEEQYYKDFCKLIK